MKVRHVLEFTSSNVSFGPHILRTLSATFTKVGFGGNAEHALEGICEENSYESVRQ